MADSHRLCIRVHLPGSLSLGGLAGIIPYLGPAAAAATNSTDADLNSTVTFPDPGLESAIRDATDKPTGDILRSDLVGLTELTA